MINFLVMKMSVMDFVRFMFIRMLIIFFLVIYMYMNDWLFFYLLNYFLIMRLNCVVYIRKLVFIVIYYVEVKYGYFFVIFIVVVVNILDEIKIFGR